MNQVQVQDLIMMQRKMFFCDKLNRKTANETWLEMREYLLVRIFKYI